MKHLRGRKLGRHTLLTVTELESMLNLDNNIILENFSLFSVLSDAVKSREKKDEIFLGLISVSDFKDVGLNGMADKSRSDLSAGCTVQRCTYWTAPW